MALPVVKSALECASYSETVAPYIYQLRPLPRIVFESILNPLALRQIYLDTNPLMTAAAFSIAIMPIFLVVSEINKNYSQVDRVWSILPTIYNIHWAVWAHMTGIKTERVGLLAIVSSLWSARLTYNYWRKGGYTIGSEDYRWAIIKDYIGGPVFFLLNISFISTIQSLLLLAVSTPGYVLLLTSRIATIKNESTLVVGDLLAPGAMLGFIVLSAVADQQQWNYQTAKHGDYKKHAKVTKGYTQDDFERGFLTKGLFAYSRHPNFLAEQNVWVSLYAWGCYSSGTSFNWTAVGAIGYLALFQGSTWLTELLSMQKYPEYQEYRKQVNMFLPAPGGYTPPPKKLTNGGTPNKDAAKARERYNLR